jgi:hypothetical protein
MPKFCLLTPDVDCGKLTQEQTKELLSNVIDQMVMDDVLDVMAEKERNL